jgi:PKD repeat protein
MQNKLLTFFTFLLILTNVNVFSLDAPKENGWCAAVAPNMDWESQIQRIISNQRSQNIANGREQQASYTIPVIVHICYFTNNTSQNIAASRVQSQIAVLNSDFAGTGLNSGTLPAPFAAVKANTNITFCLAKLDLNNNILAEPGIDRINAQTRGWGNPNTPTGWSRDFIDNTIKRTTIWDPNYYLNVWLVPSIGGVSSSILGYATFPSMTGLNGLPTEPGNALNDGFVCKTSFFGNTGGGRTSTHEIGHWLGLRHIWGDNGQCNGDDFCNDTPKQYGGTADPAGANYGCPTYPHNANLCENNPVGDMYMNFMDYTNDNCMALFTNDQSSRFQATMQFGDFRKNLKFSPACDTVLQKPVAKFTYLKQNASPCATSQRFDFTDRSLFKPTSWSWTFQGGTPATSNAQNPANILFTSGGLKDVTLTVTNSRGSHTATFQVNVPIVGTATFPFAENFEGPVFPPLGWETINRNGNPAINWDVRNGYSGYGIGNRSMIYDNTSLDGRFFKDDIQTPKINLTGVTEAKLKFDIAYAPFFGDAGNGVDEFLWDTLEVLITDNCQGTAPQRIYRKGQSDLATYPQGLGPEFYPAANQWRSDTVNIPVAYLNKPNVQLIFRNYGNYGHTIYVDNINLFSTNTTPTATASFTASDTTVCVGGSLTFTNTSTASSGSPDSVKWTIPGGVPGTSTSTTTVTPTFSTAGTYVVSLIAYKSGNASVAATKSIRVKPLPTLSVTSPAICSGNTAQPIASGNSTSYSWTGGLAAVANPTTGVLTTTTTYTVTGTRELCTATAVSTVTVNAAPTVSVNSPTICSGTTADLTVTGTATTFAWTGGLASTATPTTPVLTTTTTYTVTGTLGTCSKTAVATVTVTALPNVTVNSPSICSGATATLTATNATSYTWSPNIGGTASVTTPALTTTTTYTVTGTANGCTKSAVATVTVTAPPVVTVNSPSICSGTTATLIADGATTYSWSPNIGSTASVTTPVLTTTTTYTVTGTTGCTATAVATVTVNPSPTVNVTSPSICSGNTAQPVASGTATSYSWTGGLASTSNPTTPALTTTTTYTVTGTLGSCTKTAVATVTVNALPNVTVTSPGICSGGTATLQASGATSYTWTGGLASTANPTTPPLTTTTTYTVTGSDGSCSKTAVATVTVASSLSVTVNAPSICSGTTASLQANGATTYTWTGGLASTATPTTPALTTTTTYTVTGTSGSCTGTAVATVTVNALPNVTVNSPAICSGQTADISANGATSYTWTGGLASTATPTTPALTTTTTYTVTGTSGSCSKTAVATVTVTALPNVTVNSPAICSGQTADLIANGATSYTWTGGLASTATPTTTALTTTTTYTVTGSNGSCSGTAVSTVTVNPTPVTPGITQSGDTLYSSTIIVGATYQWFKSGVLQGTTTTPYFNLTSSGSYTVKVVNGTCTSAESVAFAAVYTSIRNNSNSIKVFEVYPNPTEGQLVMNLSLTKSSTVQIRIYTPEGRELYVKSFSSTRNVFEELNISDYAKGVYIIKLTVDEEVYYHKVVRQ